MMMEGVWTMLFWHHNAIQQVTLHRYEREQLHRSP